MSISEALQTAIYDALDGNLTNHAGDNVPIYDHVPQDTAYPYVSINNHDVASDDMLVTRVDRRQINMSVWSQYKGQREVLAVMGSIYDAFHRQRLNLASGHMILMRVTRQNASLDADGETYMGNVTVEIDVEH